MDLQVWLRDNIKRWTSESLASIRCRAETALRRKVDDDELLKAAWLEGFEMSVIVKRKW